MVCAMLSYVISMPRGPTPMAKSAKTMSPRRTLFALVICCRLAISCLLSRFLVRIMIRPTEPPIRDYFHVSDLADAACRAINRHFAGEQNIIVNLGTGPEVTRSAKSFQQSRG